MMEVRRLRLAYWNRIALLGCLSLLIIFAVMGCEEAPRILETSTLPNELRLGGVSFYTENPLENGAAVAKRQFTTEEMEIFAAFNFAGMQEGLSWGYRWYINDVEDEAYSQNGLKWNLGVTGTQVINLYNEAGLEPGAYRLDIYVKGKKLREGKFTVTNAGWAIYAHPQQGFQVLSPTAWNYTENSMGAVFYPSQEITAPAELSITETVGIAETPWDTAQMVEDDKPTAFVILTVDMGRETNQTDTTEMVMEVITRWQQQYPDIQTTELEGFTLYDWLGSTQDFLYVTEQGAARYGTVIALPVRQRIYIISFWSPAEEYDDLLARYFNPMLRSLQVDVQSSETFGDVPLAWQSYTHSVPSFGLYYPEAWQYAEDEQGVIFSPQNSASTVMFTVFTSLAWQEDDDDKTMEFVADTITRITENYSGVTTTAPEQIEFLGRGAIQQGYLYTAADGTEFGGTIIAVLAPGAVSTEDEQNNLYVYVFLMTAEYDDYDRIRGEVFDPMLNSFTILDGD